MRAEIRRARLQWKKGTLSDEKYEAEVNDYMKYAIEEQEKMGMDVLVHGEPERTDMCAPRSRFALTPRIQAAGAEALATASLAGNAAAAWQNQNQSFCCTEAFSSKQALPCSDQQPQL